MLPVAVQKHQSRYLNTCHEYLQTVLLNFDDDDEEEEEEMEEEKI
jgi:hypothetical protein